MTVSIDTGVCVRWVSVWASGLLFLLTVLSDCKRHNTQVLHYCSVQMLSLNCWCSPISALMVWYQYRDFQTMLLGYRAVIHCQMQELSGDERALIAGVTAWTLATAANLNAYIKSPDIAKQSTGCPCWTLYRQIWKFVAVSCCCPSDQLCAPASHTN